MKRTIFIIAMIIALASCDEYIQYQSSIDNQTNDTIYIYFKGKTAYIQGANTFTYLPSTHTIYSDLEGIKSKNIECDPRIDSKEVEISTNSGRMLTKDIWNANNWTCNTTNQKHIMTFVITENDLE